MGIGTIASTGWNYAKRAGNLYSDFVLGTGNEKFTQAMRETITNRKVNGQSYMESVWEGIKKGTKKAEEHNKNMIQKHGNFWKSTWHSIKTTPNVVKAGWRYGSIQGAKAGKTGLGKFWSQFKGAMKGVGKRMPLIGTLMIAATEIPNIISAFKDKGIIGGITETGKSGLRLGAGMTCAAIGSALLAPIPVVGPILGGIVGYTAGDWLMSKITGKSHSEKKLEAEEAQLAQQQALMQQYGMNPFGAQIPSGAATQNTINTPQPTMTPQQLMSMQQMLYGGGMTNTMDQDFMAMTSGLNKINYQC